MLRGAGCNASAWTRCARHTRGTNRSADAFRRRALSVTRRKWAVERLATRPPQTALVLEARPRAEMGGAAQQGLRQNHVFAGSTVAACGWQCQKRSAAKAGALADRQLSPPPRTVPAQPEGSWAPRWNTDTDASVAARGARRQKRVRRRRPTRANARALECLPCRCQARPSTQRQLRCVVKRRVMSARRRSNVPQPWSCAQTSDPW